MFEWCSNLERIISSPFTSFESETDEATKLIASVAPLKKIISLEDSALINSLTISLASSCLSVAI